MATHPTDLQLTYFDMPGRGEFIRLLLTYGGIPFDDVRIKFQDWRATKTVLHLPFGQIPTLRANGKVYAQSLALARYAAKLAGLYPASNLVALEADSLIDAILENWDKYNDIVYSDDDEASKKIRLATIESAVFPQLLDALNKRTVGPYFTGPEPTHADIYWFDFYKHALLEFPDIMELLHRDYLKLAAIAEAIRSSSQLAQYGQ
ncbi:hypothetical protein DYB32_001144 [Aphanomyces invadans]|uniref:Glutathione S-transferase n=1 Tax=Aphanomyces invadans TaxID=157072 RepID=A0A3R6VGT2_9STRA|nr:hypothetical protein DYB32_001144 [Aphanomyces invadans]